MYSSLASSLVLLHDFIVVSSRYGAHWLLRKVGLFYPCMAVVKSKGRFLSIHDNGYFSAGMEVLLPPECVNLNI